jgi:hypothetical protein
MSPRLDVLREYLCGPIFAYYDFCQLQQRAQLVERGEADLFVVNEQQITLGVHAVHYTTSLEDVQVLGLGGDDRFEVFQSVDIRFFIDGGGHGNVGDELTYLYNGPGTPSIIGGNQIFFPPFQTVFFAYIETVAI